MSRPDKMLNDGLSDGPAITIPARQLLGTVCVRGGADCPLFDNRECAQAILDRVKADPTVSIRLTSDADRIPHFTTITTDDYRKTKSEGVFNRKRDLDVFQRLGLAPGDTRRARYLYELLLQRIESPNGICSYDTPNWAGCELARSGAYESVRARGWEEIVFARRAEDKAESRRMSVERIRNDSVICMRPHHLMCMSCWVGSTGGEGERSNDTLDEIYRRICSDPDLEIMLVEGNCEACYCCDGFHPDTTRCVHSCGLIRDYKKDLDLFQKLGLMPGDTRNARELLKLIYERVPSTVDVCGYGTGIINGQEWTICGGPEGNAGYAKARETVKF